MFEPSQVETTHHVGRRKPAMMLLSAGAQLAATAPPVAARFRVQPLASDAAPVSPLLAPRQIYFPAGVAFRYLSYQSR